MKSYNKLVRDKIIDIISNDNEEPVYRVLSDEEYWQALIKKDKEELEEVIKAKNATEVKEELADKLELIRAMAEYQGYKLEDIIEEANQKVLTKGAFNKRFYLEKTFEKGDKMSKYLPLWEYVGATKLDLIKLSFDQINNILGFELDHSFLNYKKELLNYGYQVSKISLKEKFVIFITNK